MNYTYKQIWLINFPVMMSILMEQLINITDAIFLGHVGEVELGASALASVYYLAIYMLGFGFSLGLQVMIARRNGEQRYEETGKTFFQGLLFLSGLAMFLSLASYILSPVILRYFIRSPEIYNAAVDYLRHLQVEDKYKFLMAEAMISIPDIDEEIDEQVYAKVNLAIESLPEQCRLIIKLNVLEGKKYQEIAEELGITINTIRTQVSRGYKKLRDILSEEVDSSVLFFMFLKNK